MRNFANEEGGISDKDLFFDVPDLDLCFEVINNEAEV